MATGCVSDRGVNDLSRVSQIVFFFSFMDADQVNGLLIYSFYYDLIDVAITLMRRFLLCLF